MQSLASSLSKNPFLHRNGSRSGYLPLLPHHHSKSNHLFFDPLRSRQLSLVRQTWIISSNAQRNGFGSPISPSDSSEGQKHPKNALSRFRAVEIWSGRDRLPLANLNGVMTAVFLAVGICSSFSSSASASSPEEDFVRKTVSSHDIVIFSKSYCPYCTRAKGVFEKLKESPYVVELDERADGGDIQDALSSIVGRRTVPQVFVKGKHIGDSDDTVQAYQKGSLGKLLGENSNDL